MAISSRLAQVNFITMNNNAVFLKMKKDIPGAKDVKWPTCKGVQSCKEPRT